MKINPVVVSFGVALIITLVFIFILFFIFLKYLGVSDSPSAAFDNLGSWFGGIATLWAAIVAAYLFNDWRDQAKHLLNREYAEEVLKIFSLAKRDLRYLLSILNDFEKIGKFAIYEDKYKNIDIGNTLNKITQLDFRFKFLSKLSNKVTIQDLGDIERHYTIINQRFKAISLNYVGYFENLQTEIRNNNSPISSSLENSFNRTTYKFLDINLENLLKDISNLRILCSCKIGFEIVNEKSYTYENPKEIINFCINKIETIEEYFFSIIEPK